MKFCTIFSIYTKNCAKFHFSNRHILFLTISFLDQNNPEKYISYAFFYINLYYWDKGKFENDNGMSHDKL